MIGLFSPARDIRDFVEKFTRNCEVNCEELKFLINRTGLNPPFTALNCPKLPKTAQNCLKLPSDYESATLILG